ncbi:hypothetical protein ANDO1_3243 [plant metagenome]|uniref:DUF3318 domain-containing protein n=1 Tax=plant metagenome TaxID=1297885 RepID=A0A484PTH4_9ZZZZ
MNPRHAAHLDRTVRIELLRARAALEREALAANVAEVGRSLGPLALLSGATRSRGGSLLMQGIGMLRQYPFLLSSLTALFARGAAASGGVARGAGRAVKWGSLGVIAWQAWRLWLGAQRRAASSRDSTPFR